MTKIVDEILMMLSELGEIVPMPFESPYDHMKRLRSYQRGQIKNSYQYLKRRKLIREERGKARVRITLTAAGRSKLRQLVERKRFVDRRKDGYSTLIIFDIPESKKQGRDFLRNFLKFNGFTMMQRSVFIGPYRTYRGFKFLLKQLHIDSCVKVLDVKIHPD